MLPTRVIRSFSAILLSLTATVAHGDTSRTGSSAVPLDSARTGEKIAIFAPHIDDEALAAGGYVSDAVSNGAEVYIIYVTAGDHSRTALTANRITFFRTASLNRKGQRRWHEALTATRRVQIVPSNLVLLGYPDRGLNRMLARPDACIRSASTGRSVVPYHHALSPGSPYRLGSLTQDMRAVVNTIRPDVVIAPDIRDRHPDHKATAILVDRVLDQLSLSPVRLAYVIHSARALKDDDAAERVVFRLDANARARKQFMLAAYTSQRRSPYLQRLFTRFSRGDEVFLRRSS